jgi:hypothetical protein
VSSLNIFIDGTWLLNQLGGGRSLANATDHPESRFFLDFSKLNSALLRHLSANGHTCDALGELEISTSVFSLPTDFDSWPRRYSGITMDNIDKTKRAVYAREQLIREAVDGGYAETAVYRPPIREWILRKLVKGEYQEKQVDTTVVALLVRSAVTRPNDFHTVVTGDSDILPAVTTAYPQFTSNVFVTTTHPDELKAEHRQTAYSLIDFGFVIPPFYMQNKENAEQIIRGDHVHRCEECGRIFTTAKPIPLRQRPRCVSCRPPATRPRT